MATWTFTKINDFAENLAEVLYGNGVLANVTQISYTNYTDSLTTDRTLESVTSGTSSGTWTFDAADFTITASGGAIADFQYLYVYSDTPTSPADPLLGVWDAGSTISLGDGDTLNVNVNASGFVTIA